MTDTQQRIAAKKFANHWKDKGYEKGESQSFWLSLLHHVYGIENPEEFIKFEPYQKYNSKWVIMPMTTYNNLNMIALTDYHYIEMR